MRKRVPLFSFLGVATAISFANGEARTLTYTFTPVVTAAETKLHVQLEFESAPDVNEIEVPSQWAGEIFHSVLNLRAVSPGTAITNGSSPDTRKISHSGARPVVLSYDLKNDWSGPFKHPLQFHGVFLPQYFEMTGDNALVHPRLPSQAPVTVHFDWQNIPRNWVVATSFRARAGRLRLRQSYSGPWIDVQHALFAAGQFRLHRFRIGARPAVLAIIGRWTFTDDEAVLALQNTIGTVRDFWHDDHFPYFLVTFKPYDNERGNSDGSAFTNAFWMYLSHQDTLASQLATLAHETFHEWNPRRMGELSGAEDRAIEWFREGFTRYYASLLLHRAGITTLPDYAADINRDLRIYSGSSNPYIRGRIVALWLDSQMRKESNRKNSLDNVMFDMVHEANRPITEARILETAGRYLSSDGRAQLERAVTHGADLSAPDDALGPCVHVSMDEMRTFDLGFDLAASLRARRVTNVRPGGPAFQAGFREGQNLLTWSVYNDQPDKIARFGIETEGKKQNIEYVPSGKAVPVSQYHVDEGAYSANPAACRVP